MISVIGASGFIGSNLVAYLVREGIPHRAIGRADHIPAELGHVIYCIGVTGDFRDRPLDTVDAHVSHFADMIRHADYESVLYLSSTRVYGEAESGHEDDLITVDPAEPDHLYDISKICGEAVALTPGVRGRVARLSHVYGRGHANFLASLIADAASGSVVLRSAPESARDFVSIEDVCAALVAIALRGRHRVYNVASGSNVTNAGLAAALSHLTRCNVAFEPGSGIRRSPLISTDRIRDEFGFSPRALLDDLEGLLGNER